MYCNTVWGGIPKTNLKTVETAQRAVLKVCTFKPYRYPTSDLFSLCEVLTVRQLFVLSVVLKKHSALPYDPTCQQGRRKDIIFKQKRTCRTTFAQRFYAFLGTHLYNRLSKNISIYGFPKYKCKNEITKFLLKLSYEETEDLFHIPK